MKIIPIESLSAGMRLGRDLFGKNGVILLRRGVALTDSMIQSIRQLQYASIYVLDGIGDDVNLAEAELIQEDRRQTVIHVVKQTFIESLQSTKVSKNKGLDVNRIVAAAKEIVRTIMQNPGAVVALIDIKSFDEYTFQHSVNVCLLAVIIGKKLKLPTNNLEDLALGALLHDLGKMEIPSIILNKPGKLTEDEFDQVKNHPRAGFDATSGNPFISAHAKAVILQHHEKFNGTGYPKGLQGNNIHMNGRIVAVADVYDALTSDRPYRPRFLPHQALGMIQQGAGTQFDPNIVEAFR
ncbi:MAG: HD-GYP domain-containing protein, partial [Bacteroidota bacterium]